jgi:hypothetical protein
MNAKQALDTKGRDWLGWLARAEDASRQMDAMDDREWRQRQERRANPEQVTDRRLRRARRVR